jgi:hypothetical protein
MINVLSGFFISRSIACTSKRHDGFLGLHAAYYMDKKFKAEHSRPITLALDITT